MQDENEIERAAEFIRDGKLVSFPTETVYGLGGNALRDDAVAAIFEAKGRPSFNPLIVHVGSVGMAQTLVEWNEHADRLAKKFWPGPLTFVLPRKETCEASLLASAGLDTLAVRCPAHPIAQRLIAKAGVPIAAPSANRSGRISPTKAEHVREELGNRVAAILDGGPTEVGLESTVVDLSGPIPILLRPGSITIEELRSVIPATVFMPGQDAANDAPISPGLLKSHYAPELKVRLNANTAEAGEALLAFGDKVPAGAACVLNLSESGDLQEAAANLFAYLRELDKPDYTGIAVMPIPHEGLGVAINDRLNRAAAER